MKGTYSVNEIFYSLQGEGFWTGRPALFIRFAGCNLKCPFCDTLFQKGTSMDLLTIAAQIEAYESCGFVVLTGGEPSLQVDEELCQMLHNKGLYIAMETNGTHAITNGVDWITCSPKSAFLPHALPVITQADEVKVIYDGIHEVSTCGINCKYQYLQPCDVGNDKKNRVIVQQAIHYVMEHPEWTLSLQMHKLVGIR